MKSHDNLERLVAWWRDHPEPVTIVSLVVAGLIAQRDASNTMQYGVRYGVVERIGKPGARHITYRWTGRPMPPAPRERKPARERVTHTEAPRATSGPSFEALLTAWGIATVPPRLPAAGSCQSRSLDD